ncbi:MAG: hypothetical protein MJB57_09710 [Gemmatimonadetes bacterium]|nr:hypothetical protein [Gemmatimonadota bacterium]
MTGLASLESWSRGARRLVDGSTRRFTTAGLVIVAALSAVGSLAAQGGRTHVLVVTGLGGEPEYAQLFRTQATAFLDAARDRWGVPESDLSWLAEDPAVAPERVAAKSTRDAVEERIEDMAAAAGADDRILLLFMGHGSGSGDDSKINLPGPDVSGADLAVWLEAFPTQTVAVVNAASASGGFIPALGGERRVIVTATRTANERWRTHFGTFFVDAFALDGADADKDDRVSLLEAFTYAKAEVERYYARDGQIPTEHALLDDNGDGEGSLEATIEGPDGALASRFFLTRAPRALAGRTADDPELAALLEKKTRLEEDIAALRARRDEMDATSYEARLEALLLELAVTSRAIRDREGGAR